MSPLVQLESVQGTSVADGGIPVVYLPAAGILEHWPRLDPAEIPQALATMKDLHHLANVLRTNVSIKSAERDEAFERAIWHLGRLADSFCASRQELRTLAGQSTHPVHRYFGVAGAELTPKQHIAEAMQIVYRLVSDLSIAPLDIQDVCTLVDCTIAILNRFAPSPDVRWNGMEEDITVEPLVNGGSERWQYAHHMYFLLNVYAEFALRKAIEALDRGDVGSATSLIYEGAMWVRGLSAAMMHSGAITASYYQERLRRTMQPPATAVVLTGAMQLEHAAYRVRLGMLLERLPEDFVALAQRDLALGLARDALLDADLIDIERHICLAHSLVGNDHSLVQHHGAPTNAVGALRLMRHERAARYCALMSYGDRGMTSADIPAKGGEACPHQ